MKNLIKLMVMALCLSACKSNLDKNNTFQQTNEGKIADTIATMPIGPLVEGEESLTEDSFGKIRELKGQQISTNEIFKVRETEMIVKDSFLIMKNLSDKNMFKVFSLPQFKLIKTFGLNGRGPDEFQYPHIVKSEDKNTLCIVFESTNSKVYNLDRNLNLHVSPFKFPKAKEMFDEKQLAGFSNTNFYYVSNATRGKAIYRSNLERDSVATKEIYNLAFSKEHKNWGNYIGDFGAN